MEVHGPASSRTRRVLWACEEAGAAYTHHSMTLRDGDHRSEPYTRLNPNAKVPALVDGDLVLFESGAIVHYIASKFPDAKLLPPAGSSDYAHALKWMFWVATELEQPLWSLGKHRFVLPEAHRIPQMLETAAFEWRRPAEVLAEALEGREFLVGDRFGVADIMAGHTLNWARGFGMPLGSDVAQAYLERLVDRAAFKRTLAL